MEIGRTERPEEPPERAMLRETKVVVVPLLAVRPEGLNRERVCPGLVAVGPTLGIGTTAPGEVGLQPVNPIAATRQPIRLARLPSHGP